MYVEGPRQSLQFCPPAVQFTLKRKLDQTERWKGYGSRDWCAADGGKTLGYLLKNERTANIEALHLSLQKKVFITLAVSGIGKVK